MSGHHLVGHFAGAAEKARENALRDDVRMMAYELERLVERNRRLKKEILAGQLRSPAQFYQDQEGEEAGCRDKELLNVASGQSLLRDRLRRRKNPQQTKTTTSAPSSEAEDAWRRVEATDKLELLKLTTGLTAVVPTEEEGEDELSLVFNPCVLGTVRGPFRVQLKREEVEGNGKRWRCDSHDLPLPQSILDLDKELSQLGAEDKDMFSALVSRIGTLLRAFLSRKEQFEALRDNFGGEQLVDPVAEDEEYTRIRFGLKTQMEDEEEDDAEGEEASKVTKTFFPEFHKIDFIFDNQTLLVEVRLKYEVDSERPLRKVEGSVKLDSRDLSLDNLDELREQCEAFHRLPLCQAINEAL